MPIVYRADTTALSEPQGIYYWESEGREGGEGGKSIGDFALTGLER